MPHIRSSKSLLALAFAVALAGHTLPAAADVQGIFKMGYDFGGDEMVTVPFTDGSTKTIKSNEGFYLGGGVAFLNRDRTWELDLTLAYKFKLINASNGDVTWSTVPFEALAFYRFDYLRLGGGVAYHINPRLEGTGIASNLDIKFKDALGGIVQVDWLITENVALGLRYTFLEYEAKAPFTGTAKSDGAGVTFSWNFF
jgi:hypothetical protein